MKFLLFILLIFSLNVTLISSWSTKGHIATGIIASKLLSQKELEYYNSLISIMSSKYPNIETIGEACRWADDIRDGTIGDKSMQYSLWHTMRKCYSLDNIKCKRIQNPNTLTGLTEILSILTNKTSTIEDQSLYFLLLLHIIGDMHQPLHNIRLFSEDYPTGDKGSNDFEVQYMGETYTLHAIWDDICIVDGKNPRRPFSKYPAEKEKMEELADQYLKNYIFNGDEVKFSGDNSDFEKWMDDAYNLAIKYSYSNGKLKNEQEIDEIYLKQCKSIADRQIALAGRRLAEVLHYIYLKRFIL